MTSSVKIAITITTLGTIGAGGAIANSFLNVETIKQKLAKEGFNLDIDASGWDAILVSYNKLEDTKKTFKSKASDKDTAEGLKQKCENFWKQSTISEGDYKKLKQWCVKEETIETVLIRAKYKKLDTESSDTNVTNKWKAKVDQLKLKKTAFSTVKLTDAQDADVSALKGGCRGLKVNELKTTGDGFNEKLEQARDWCFE